MAGTFPIALVHLPKLQILRLVQGRIQGPLPQELPSSLEILELAENAFTGTIPHNWFQKNQNLKIMALSQNQITGTIPTQIGACTSLQSVALDRNEIQGTIPSTITSLENLYHIDLSSNNLNGTIPFNIGELTNLVVLLVGFNELTGPMLPESAAMLGNLFDYSGSENPFDEAELPEFFYQLTYLSTFKCVDCNLVGPIRPDIFDLIRLVALNLSRNNLTGTLPSELGRLPDLKFADVSSTNLHGTVPEELCLSRLMEQLVVDCLYDPDSENATAALECQADCCTMCCNKEQNLCMEI
jgi:Leucine-rich repeat (LRR) protein